MRESLKAGLIFLAIMSGALAGCAPSNFNGASGAEGSIPRKDTTHTDDGKPLDPSIDDQPPTLPPEDLQVLSDCGKKAGQNFANTSKFQVESADIDLSMGNRSEWQDTMAISDKPRVLIVTISGQVANRPSVELGNPNTTYCLNVKLRIVNRFDLRVSKTARVIEVYDTQIMNRATRTQI